MIQSVVSLGSCLFSPIQKNLVKSSVPGIYSLGPALSPSTPVSLFLSSVSFLPLTPSVSSSLPSAFQNEGAKLLFPSHYLICASPLGCKSSRYSSPILHELSRSQAPAANHKTLPKWKRGSETKDKEDRQPRGNRRCAWNVRVGAEDLPLRWHGGKKRGQKIRQKWVSKRHTRDGKGFGALIEATGPSESLNEGSGTGNKDNNVPYFSGKDKSWHCGKAKCGLIRTRKWLQISSTYNTRWQLPRFVVSLIVQCFRSGKSKFLKIAISPFRPCVSSA